MQSFNKSFSTTIMESCWWPNLKFQQSKIYFNIYFPSLQSFNSWNFQLEMLFTFRNDVHFLIQCLCIQGLNRIANIMQTLSNNTFYGTNCTLIHNYTEVFFLGFKISKHRVMQWPGSEWVTSHYLNKCWSSSLIHMYATRSHWGQDKRADICRRHFQVHFLEWKCLNFD